MDKVLNKGQTADFNAALEEVKEDLLKKELQIMDLSRGKEGRTRDKLDCARVHVEIAMRQILHIMYPDTEPDTIPRNIEIPEITEVPA